MKREELERLANSGEWGERKEVANLSGTPPEILQRLAHDGDEDVRGVARTQLAQRGLDWHLEGDAKLKVLCWLSAHKDAVNRRKAAEDLDCSPEILAELANDVVQDIRIAVARHSSTPPEILSHLAEDRNLWIRFVVALNSRTPSETLRHLSHDVWSIRKAVAANPKTPLEILDNLAMDEERNVRYAVAGNLNAPISILKRLSEDEDDDVRAAAREQLEQRQCEPACAGYEAGLETGGTGYGYGL